MNNQHLVLAVFWALFCAMHSLLAALWWKERVKRIMGKQFRYYRLYYSFFAFGSMGAVLYYQLSIDSPFLFKQNTASAIAGSLLCASGLVVMAICIRKYFLHLSGVKSLYLNDSEAANQLQISGIHRYVRHPLYSGTFLAIWGLWLLQPQLSLLIADVVITGYTLLAIGWEEQKLEAEFGDSYRRYKKQVPKLIPLRGKTAHSLH